MRTAVYARVSTSDQNCDLQRRELREYCQRRGWEPVADTVVNGINNLGQIVGTVGDKTGFLYTNGVFTTIEAPATAFTPEPNSYTLILGGVSLLLLRQKIV